MEDRDNDASDREQRLDEVATVYLKAQEAGQAPDRQALLDRYPELAAELREFFADQDRIDRLAAPLRPLAVSSGPGISPTPLPMQTADETVPLLPPPPRSFGDYTVLAALGQGGMGVVWKARQRRPDRLVALKMFRAGDLTSPVDIRRFRNEAEVIAQLDHPHILPVYEVGEHDGVHFFSMKLLEGGSLADRLESFRADPRAAARLLATVARAVHYAHQRGVLHRDLKPSNILLDAQGEPHVSDFGLAKRVQSDSGLTQSGALVGTPSYMAPEQAGGRKEAITTAADVYGLGAVLYALLTGRPPFWGETVLETLEQVKAREPEPPRRINVKVDRDLETICLKCLHKESQRRYESAQALAEDLERWLGGKPIRARRAGSRERLLKWMRRRPALAALSALTVFSAAALVAGVLWHDARLQAEAARTARERDKAREQQRQARRVVDDMYTQVAEKWLARQPHLQPIQREFLEKALRYYQELTETDDTDPEARLELGRSYQRVGSIQTYFGDNARAEQAFRRAADVLQALTAERPDEAEVRTLLALVWSSLSQVLVRVGDNPQAEQAARRAIAIFNQLKDEGLATPVESAHLADCYLKLGQALERTRGPREAEEAYRMALRILEDLGAESSADPDRRMALVNALQDLSAVLYATQQFKLAQEALERGVRHAEREVQGDPTSGQYRAKLALLQQSLGVVYCRTNQNPAAEKSLRRAQRSQVRLAGEYPDFSRYKEELAATYNVLGNVCGPKEAEEAYRESIKLKEQLAADSPNVPYYRLDLVQSLNNLTGLLTGAGRMPEATRANAEARRHAERLLRDFPGVADHQKALARTYQRRADIELAAGRAGAAAAEWKQALEVSSDPDIRDGAAQFLAQCPDPKYRNLARALELARENVRVAPENYGYWEVLGLTEYRAGHAAEAVRALERAIRLGSTDSVARLLLAMARWAAGDRSRAQRDYDAAREQIKKSGEPDTETRAFLAEAAALFGSKEKSAPEGKR